MKASSFSIRIISSALLLTFTISNSVGYSEAASASQILSKNFSTAHQKSSSNTAAQLSELRSLVGLPAKQTADDRLVAKSVVQDIQDISSLQPNNVLERSELRTLTPLNMLDILSFINGVRAGNDFQAGQLISIIENGGELADYALTKIDEIALTSKPHKVGITGGVGVGKSTLVEDMLHEYRKQGKRVAVIAIDPTSPFTGGAILADRMRLSMDLVTDQNVFYRSMATRGGIGGIAKATARAIKVFDIFGIDSGNQKDVVIIETEGVGQSQKDIRKIVDTMVAAIPPASGDVLTLSKDSFINVADVVVVNKSDRKGADETAKIAEQIFKESSKEDVWTPRIIQTIAIQGVKESGKGITELVQAVGDHQDYLVKHPKNTASLPQEFKQPKGRVLVIEFGEKNDALVFASAARAQGFEVVYVKEKWNEEQSFSRIKRMMIEEDVDAVYFDPLMNNITTLKNPREETGLEDRLVISYGARSDGPAVYQLFSEEKYRYLGSAKEVLAQVGKRAASRRDLKKQDVEVTPAVAYEEGQRLIVSARSGDAQAAASLMSLLESQNEIVRKAISEQVSEIPRQSHRIGIAGPPGVGKSSLISKFAKELRSAGLKVGIVAVDPSSDATGGALLIDRYRMGELVDDPGVAIRSLSLRDGLGGISKFTNDTASILDLTGADVVLIETEGSGQTQGDIKKLVDTTVLVLSPSYLGDIQTMKAGSMESPDITVLNQADTERSFVAMRELEAGLSSQPPLSDGWKRAAVQATATEGKGSAELLMQLANRVAYIAGKSESANEKQKKIADALKKAGNSVPLLIRALRETHNQQPIIEQLGKVLQNALDARKSLWKDKEALAKHVKGVDHVAIAVHGAESFGRPVYEVAKEKVKVVMIPNPTGEGRIELIDPTDPESAVSKFREKLGETLHHAAFEVDNLAEAIQAVRDADLGDVQIFDQGRNDHEGYSLQFFFVKNAKLLVEFLQYDSGAKRGHTQRVLDFGDLPEHEKLGKYPFTRGIYTEPKGGVRYIPRQYSGQNTARETNARFLKLNAKATSNAFQNAGQQGRNTDHPLNRYNVGQEGVAIDSVRDMAIVYNGIDILAPDFSASMTINAAAAPMLAIYIANVMKRWMSEVGGTYEEALAFAKKTIRVTVQNDNRKEYITRNNDGISETGADELTNQMFEYFSDWKSINTISISGYHMREAGASDVQEVAFTLMNAVFYAQSYFDYMKRKGKQPDVDSLLKQFTFFFDSLLYDEQDKSKNNLFRETAKFRAARRLWAKIAKHILDAKDEKSMHLRFHSQTAGVNLFSDDSGVELDLNVARIALEAQAAILGGTQSLHIDSKDEPIKLPGDFEAQVANRTHSVLQATLDGIYDDVGDSEVVSRYTDEIEKDAFDLIQTLIKLNEKEGHQAVAQHMKEAIQNESVRKGIERSKAASERSKKSGNSFTQTQAGIDSTAPISDGEMAQKITTRMEPYSQLRDEVNAGLQVLLQTRDGLKVAADLSQLRDVTKKGENIMPSLIQAAFDEATVGEMMDIQREHFGDTKRSIFPARTNRQDALKPIESTRPIRALLVKPGLDGHDRGINLVTAALKNAGVEVVYGGLRQTPEMVAQAAVQENVDFIGISSLSGARLHFVSDLMAELDKLGAGDKIRVVVGGITENDGPMLKHSKPFEYRGKVIRLGVDFVADPSHGTGSLTDILNYVQSLADEVAPKVPATDEVKPRTELRFVDSSISTVSKKSNPGVSGSSDGQYLAELQEQIAGANKILNKNPELLSVIWNVLTGLTDVPPTGTKIGLILPRRLVFDEGFAAFMPAFMQAFGNFTEVAILVGSEVDINAVYTLNETLPAGINRITYSKSPRAAAKKLLDSRKVAVVKYMTVAASQEELGQVDRYVNEVINLSKEAFRDLKAKFSVSGLAQIMTNEARAYQREMMSA